MNKELLKKKACEIIDANRDRLFDIGMDLYHHPQTGYKELYASEKVQKVFDELGLKHEDNLAITGVKAELFDKAEGPNVCIMGELDSLIIPEHPDCDPETGAAHCCGHFAQITTMLGSAIALTALKDEIDGGNVTFFAVPAEECIEIEYRKGLIDEGKIKYLGGKQELIHLGCFDDVDVAMMVHSGNSSDSITADSKSVGFVAKNVLFKGRAAHAGGSPWNGINALDAATLALTAINAIRSTLKDQDCIRIHPIITKGGSVVNAVPDDVRMELYVRGATVEAIKDANFKVNRAIKGAAYAIGAEVEIIDLPGYLPCSYESTLAHIFGDNAAALFPDRKIIYSDEMEGGSSDMGDIATVVPAVQGSCGGITGDFHSKDFTITNKEMLFLDPAKIMACTVIDLLADDAAKAKEVMANFKSPYNTKNFDGIWDAIMGE